MPPWGLGRSRGNWALFSVLEAILERYALLVGVVIPVTKNGREK